MAIPKTNSVAAAKEPLDIKVVPLLAVLLSGAFVAILNETLLNVALEEILVDFSISRSSVQWLTTGYMLVIGSLVPVSAYFVQRFTTRQLFFAAMGFFTIGTLIAGFSPVFTVLLIGRLIQAIGTAIMIPLLTNIVLAVIPIERRGAAMGMIGLVIMFAPAIGPTLSGIIVQNLSWRWLFFFVLPISGFSMIYGYFVLKNVIRQTNPTIDIISVILSILGFGGIVFGFGSAGEGEGGWLDPEVVLSLVIGSISLALFVWRQIKLKTPMLDMRVFRYSMFSLALVLMIIVMMTMFAMMLVLPMYLRSVLVFSAVLTGLVLLPGGLINGAISPIMGRLFDKFGPRVLLIPGLALMVLVVFLFRFVEVGTAPWVVVVLHSLLMIAVAMVMMPAQTNGLNQLPPELYPHGTAVANTLMQVSGAIGTALFISIMENGTRRALEGVQNPTIEQSAEAMAVGVQQAFTVGLIMACFGFILSLFVKRVIIPAKETA